MRGLIAPKANNEVGMGVRRGGERHGRREERSREKKRPISMSAHLEQDVELVPHRPPPVHDSIARRRARGVTIERHRNASRVPTSKGENEFRTPRRMSMFFTKKRRPRRGGPPRRAPTPCVSLVRQNSSRLLHAGPLASLTSSCPSSASTMARIISASRSSPDAKLSSSSPRAST